MYPFDNWITNHKASGKAIYLFVVWFKFREDQKNFYFDLMKPINKPTIGINCAKNGDRYIFYSLKISKKMGKKYIN